MPVLRKDFTVDEFNVLEAAGGRGRRDPADCRDSGRGISCVAIGNWPPLSGWLRWWKFTMKRNWRKALRSGAEIVGVNNRDLHTFQVSLETSVERSPRKIPGYRDQSERKRHLKTNADVQMLMEHGGFHALLVGEQLIRNRKILAQAHSRIWSAADVCEDLRFDESGGRACRGRFRGEGNWLCFCAPVRGQPIPN